VIEKSPRPASSANVSVMLMFAHAAFDLTAVAMIYWNLESEVAHLLFK
jgi:hypothetical protein